MPAGNAKFLMDSVFELSQRINRFRLADAEIGLFCAVVIITAGKYSNQGKFGAKSFEEENASLFLIRSARPSQP